MKTGRVGGRYKVSKSVVIKFNKKIGLLIAEIKKRYVIKDSSSLLGRKGVGGGGGENGWVRI